LGILPLFNGGLTKPKDNCKAKRTGHRADFFVKKHFLKPYQP